MKNKQQTIARFHLPGLFEFYEFYKVFLPLFYENREFFYDHVEISSIYGAPDECIWGGGRFGLGDEDAKNVLTLLGDYNISARLTFSNSQLRKEHLSDQKCNHLCDLFAREKRVQNGVIIHSELLLKYLMEKYPNLYFVSSTTKVITEFEEFQEEVNRPEFRYVVPDFRLNKRFDLLGELSKEEKDKIEFLCNECCFIGCKERKACYENVSRRILDEDVIEHKCQAENANEGYLFSKAMKNPAFIGNRDIQKWYLPNGFSNFKIEGRELGSALLLEMLIYYMVKPEYQLQVREKIYLDSMLNLF